jgi:hypothetical protein
MAQRQQEELDAAAAVSALQWAVATVACTRTGYPKVDCKRWFLHRHNLTLAQPSDISVPPVIRKLQLQSASLAAAAASMSATIEHDICSIVGDRRAAAVLFSDRCTRANLVAFCAWSVALQASHLTRSRRAGQRSEALQTIRNERRRRRMFSWEVRT